MNINKYTRPDVYVKRDLSPIPHQEEQTQVLSVPVFVGICNRGDTSKPIDVYNWSDFKNKTSLGLDSPFTNKGYLPHVVWDFYKNNDEKGKVKIIRVVGAGSKYATVKIPKDSGIEFKAKDKGEWANKKVKVVVSKETGSETFNIKVLVNDEENESFSGLTKDNTSSNYAYVLNKYSNYITVDVSTSVELSEGEGVLDGGEDDLSNITLDDYKKALKLLDPYEDFGLVCLTEQNSLEAHKELQSYCKSKGKCVPIMSSPLGATVDTLISQRKELQKQVGAMYYPWEKIIDPASPTEQTKLIPPLGAICGNIARTDKVRGTHKAPAGTQCALKMAIGTETALSVTEKKDDVAILLANDINPILVKAKRGVVIWGAESLSGNSISKDRLDMDVELKCYDDTDWSIFEPSSIDLCDKVKASLDDTLRTFYKKGAFKGRTEKEAFYVKCDEELNPQSQLDEGYIRAEIGYADKKPNKFTIITIKRFSGQQ